MQLRRNLAQQAQQQAKSPLTSAREHAVKACKKRVSTHRPCVKATFERAPRRKLVNATHCAQTSWRRRGTSAIPKSLALELRDQFLVQERQTRITHSTYMHVPICQRAAEKEKRRLRTTQPQNPSLRDLFWTPAMISHDVQGIDGKCWSAIPSHTKRWSTQRRTYLEKESSVYLDSSVNEVSKGQKEAQNGLGRLWGYGWAWLVVEAGGGLWLPVEARGRRRRFAPLLSR